ncbi:MAG TPA: DUF3105 domain-containing protein [Actinomycetota bacterium]
MRLRPLVFLLVAACASGGGSSTFTPEIDGSAPCSSAQDVQVMSTVAHIEPGTTAQYNSDPPTSGEHYSIRGTAPAPVGVYPDPIENERQVHNLEHGHVVVQYRDLTDEELDAVRAPVLADPFMMLMAPRPQMEWKLALTSWGKLQVCREIPDDVGELIRTFVVQNRDNAPESIP